MKRIFLDMDGVVVDFDGHMKKHGMTADEIKRDPDAYALMDPMPGALAGIRYLLDMGCDVWLATKPPTGRPFAYSAKARWVMSHTPALVRKLIITPDKGLLGDEHDVLVDDRPHKGKCFEFPGMLIVFGDPQYGKDDKTYFAGDWQVLIGHLIELGFIA
jgi:5'(3')-deoxyribonucleotidase